MNIQKATAYIILPFFFLQNFIYTSFALDMIDSSEEIIMIEEIDFMAQENLIISDEAFIGLISDEVEIDDNVEEEIDILEKEIDITKINSNLPEFSNDRVIIKYKSGESEAGKDAATESIKQSYMNGASIENLENLDIGLITFDDPSIQKEDIEKTIQDLNKLPYIEYAEPDYILSIQALSGVETNDPRSEELWHLKSIHADDAWNIYHDTENKTLVGVNDTGIDYTHPDLIGNLKDLSSDCKSSTGAVIVGGCSNYGRNMESSSYRVLSEDDTYDVNGHGTHVSGIIGAIRNNNTGIVGVTENVEIISSRIDTYNSLYEVFYMSDTIKALDFAIQNNVKVVNASYGGPSFSQASYDAIQRARDNDILVIIASGNEDSDNDITPSYPASYDLDNIISVGSVGPDDTLASYSNYGKNTVDIFAPGGDIIDFETGEGGILSTYPGQEIVWSENFDSGTGFTITGTGSDWYIYSEGRGIHTQSTLTYTGAVNSVITFNTPFSLSGATLGMLEGNISCDFGTSGAYDADFGDELSFYVYEQDYQIDNLISLNFSSYVGAGRYSFKVPITQSYLFKDNLQFKINFVTDSDNDVGSGCWIDNLKITAHKKGMSSYKYSQGTSMSAPVVSGVVAMLWSYKPELSYSEIKDIIFGSVDNLGLQDISVTGGKINTQTALLELIQRYGISKSGDFGSGSIYAKNIDISTEKIISLSGGIITLTGTGEIVSLQGNAVISGTGEIYIPYNTSITHATGTLLSNDSNINVILRDSYDMPITGSGQIVYGEGIYVSYSGSVSGSGTYIKIGDIYDGALNQGQYIPIGSSFSGAMDIQIYKQNILDPYISDGIKIILQETMSSNMNFIYSKKYFEITPFSNDRELGQDVGFLLQAIDIDGDVLNSYTGSILIESISDSEAMFSGSLANKTYIFQAGDNGEKIFTGALSFSSTGNHDISVQETGSGGMTGSGFIQILAASIPEGSISFSTENITNQTGSIIMISSSEYPVDYIVSGNIVESYSGTLSQTGALNIEFSRGEGIKNIFLQLVDEDGNIGNISQSIILDQTSPHLSISSHSDNQYIQGESISFTGTIIENNDIDSMFIQNRSINSSLGYWETEVFLSGGLNSISYVSTDAAANTSTGSINIIRIPQVSNMTPLVLGTSDVLINFDTDVLSLGTILYGSSSGNLDLSENFEIGRSHSISLSGLQVGTQYFYTVRANTDEYEGIVRPINTFTTQDRRSGGGGGGGKSRTRICKQDDLVCKLVPGLEKTYKYYKVDGLSCRGGNLGQVCNMDTVRVLKKSDSSKVMTFFQITKVEFKEFDEISQDERIHELYNDYIQSWKILTSGYKIKSQEQKDIDTEKFISLYTLLNNEIQGLTPIIKKKKQSSQYTRYNNKRITKIQILLLARIRKNNGTSEDYEDVHNFLESISIFEQENMSEQKNITLRKKIVQQYKKLRFPL